jgi:antitoxin PrlF
METATLTCKGQLTLPKAVRDKLHLRTGDRLRVEVTEDGRIVLQPATVDVLELKGMLPTPAKPLGLADIERIIRERARK